MNESFIVGGFEYKQDDKGVWQYSPIEKSLKADTLYGRKEKVEYQDKAELKLLEEIETQSKNDFKEMIKFTVLDIAKYLKTIVQK